MCTDQGNGGHSEAWSTAAKYMDELRRCMGEEDLHKRRLALAKYGHHLSALSYLFFSVALPCCFHRER